MQDDHDWLGREFATWVWFGCEVEGGEFPLPSGALALVVLDDIVLVGEQVENYKTTVKGAQPSQRPEAASALASGMLVQQLRLMAVREEREWNFKLHGETLDLRSVKLPECEAAEPLEVLAERLESFAEIRLAMDELYAMFLERKLAADWESFEAERMRGWIGLKMEEAEKAHEVAAS